MKGMPSTSSGRVVVTVLAGLLAFWGCADFDKAQQEFCQRHPSLCTSADGGTGTDTGSPPAADGGTGSDAGSPPGTPLDVFVLQASAGSQHSVALASDGSVWAWGLNTSYQVGDAASLGDHAVPFRVTGLPAGMKGVAAGLLHSLALSGNGEVWAWGKPDSGSPHAAPKRVDKLSDIVEIAAGGSFSLARTQSNSVWFWGNDGAGHSSDVPVDMGLTSVVAIAAGGAHSLVLDKDGRVWAWGDNSVGQLGLDSSIKNSATPVQVSGLPTNVTFISAGGLHSLARTSDGQVWTWGDNTWGQLGDGSTGGSRFSPRLVLTSQTDTLTNIREVAGGFSYSLAVNNDNEIRAWGRDDSGQLGILPFVDSPFAVKARALTNALHISAGQSHSMAVLSDGHLATWGSNSHGQLGISGDLPAGVVLFY